MKRRVTSTLLYLLAGALTTVAVAWAFALLVDPAAGLTTTSYSRRATGPNDNATAIVSHTSAPGTSVWNLRHFDAVSIFDNPDLLSHTDVAADLPSIPALHSALALKQRDVGPWTDWTFEVRGWPFQAMWCDRSSVPSAPTRSAGPGAPLTYGGVWVETAGPAGTFQTTFKVLPLFILPAGFALDTLAYAGLWFLMFLLGSVAIRRFRTPPGHCHNCRYNLTGLPASSLLCPECGNEIPAQPPLLPPSSI